MRTLHEPAEIENLVIVLSEKGWSQRRVATELGVARKRVRSALAHAALQRSEGHSALPKLPKRRGSAIDAHSARIAELIEQYEDITAVRLQDELQKDGFSGGYSMVKERLRELRPRPKRAYVERFETMPGEQGQQDWSPYKIDFTEEGRKKVHCFSFILGFSRRQYIHFCEREDQLTLFRQHVRGAERFNGFTKEILYDGQKNVVLRREAGRPIYNLKFLAFATHYAFRPVALPPRSPELKGKVERPFQYIEGNCLNARTFKNIRELNEHADWWMDNVSDTHNHETTRERPMDRFAREANALVPLPACPYDTAEVGYRVVSVEGHIEHDAVKYSVPHVHVLDLAVVRATEHEIVVYGRNLAEIARHERAPRGHDKPVVNPAHRPVKDKRVDIEILVARMAELGDEGAQFAAGVCRTQRYRGSHLAQVLSLVERYDADAIVKALRRVVHYRAFDGQAVTRILEATATLRPLPDSGLEAAQARLRETSRLLEVKPRSLREYASALGESGPREPEDSNAADPAAEPPAEP